MKNIVIFSQVAWHLLALLAVIAWTGIVSLIVLLPLLLCGKLRITDADERSGMDVKKIKEQSYHGSHCCDCKCKSNASHMPTIIVPRSQNKLTTISGNVITPTTSFDGTVSIPLPSPTSSTAQHSPSAAQHFPSTELKGIVHNFFIFG